MIKLGEKVSSIILEAMRGKKVRWYNYSSLLSKDRLLQTDKSVWLVKMKVPIAKKAKGIINREGVQPKKQQRPVFAGKRKMPCIPRSAPILNGLED